MNRALRRKQDKERKKKARNLYKNSETFFEKIDLNEAEHIPPGMSRAFRNNRYTVMVYDNQKTTKGEATSVLIQKLDNTKITNHWSEIQRIKNEIFGKETPAVEYYPAESELINDHNIYWIWIFPEGVLPIPIL